MNEDLEVVVICIEDCRLTEEYGIFSVWVPPHYRCVQDNSRELGGQKTYDDLVLNRPICSKRSQVRQQCVVPTVGQQTQGAL